MPLNNSMDEVPTAFLVPDGGPPDLSPVTAQLRSAVPKPEERDLGMVDVRAAVDLLLADAGFFGCPLPMQLVIGANPRGDVSLALTFGTLKHKLLSYAKARNTAPKRVPSPLDKPQEKADDGRGKASGV